MNNIELGTIITDPKTGVSKVCIAVNTYNNHDAGMDEPHTEYVWKTITSGGGSSNPFVNEFQEFVTHEGVKLYWAYSKDGKDLFVYGNGAISFPDFYCTDAPWKSGIGTCEKVILGSEITTYMFYAFGGWVTIVKHNNTEQA